MQTDMGSHERRGRHRLATTGIVAGVVSLLAAVPACSSSSTPTSAPVSTSTTTSTSPPVTFQQGSAAQVAACQTDAQSLETALSAYMAENGAYPSPPSPWSAATYVANFAPLTSAAAVGGPYMAKAPATTAYVIEYDSAGHLWVAPPGSYGATYNPGQSFEANADICLAAVR